MKRIFESGAKLRTLLAIKPYCIDGRTDDMRTYRVYLLGMILRSSGSLQELRWAVFLHLHITFQVQPPLYILQCVLQNYKIKVTYRLVLLLTLRFLLFNSKVLTAPQKPVCLFGNHN